MLPTDAEFLPRFALLFTYYATLPDLVKPIELRMRFRGALEKLQFHIAIFESEHLDDEPLKRFGRQRTVSP
jgi:hypothetical protein